MQMESQSIHIYFAGQAMVHSLSMHFRCCLKAGWGLTVPGGKAIQNILVNRKDWTLSQMSLVPGSTWWVFLCSNAQSDCAWLWLCDCVTVTVTVWLWLCVWVCVWLLSYKSKFKLVHTLNLIFYSQFSIFKADLLISVFLSFQHARWQNTQHRFHCGLNWRKLPKTMLKAWNQADHGPTLKEDGNKQKISVWWRLV